MDLQLDVRKEQVVRLCIIILNYLITHLTAWRDSLSLRLPQPELPISPPADVYIEGKPVPEPEPEPVIEPELTKPIVSIPLPAPVDLVPELDKVPVTEDAQQNVVNHSPATDNIYPEPDTVPPGCLKVRWNGNGEKIIPDFRGWSVRLYPGDELVVSDETYEKLTNILLPGYTPGQWEVVEDDRPGI